MNAPYSYLLVFLGAGLGGALRHAFNGLAARVVGSDFPTGTLVINVVGSLAIGLLAGYFAFKGESTQSMRLFLTTGLLGGFTTFSAFALETTHLLQRGQLGAALGYACGSVALSVAGVFVGLAVMKA